MILVIYVGVLEVGVGKIGGRKMIFKWERSEFEIKLDFNDW